MKKKIIVWLLSTSIAFSTVAGAISPVYAAEKPQLQVVNKESARYDNDGYRELYFDNNAPVSKRRDGMVNAQNTDAKYMSVSELAQKYPGSRDQAPYGTCWAFAAIALAEFDMINKNYVTKDVDYSELQLAYFTYFYAPDPIGGTSGDFLRINPLYGNYLDLGGNTYLAMRTMSKGIGIISESEAPYSLSTDTLVNGLNASLAYGQRQAYLKNAYMINIKAQPQNVKQAIIEHGAVAASYYHENGYDTTTTLSGGNSEAVYFYGDSSAEQNIQNHGIAIVGWDDNFPKEVFPKGLHGNKPASNGAWLIRNSWTTETGSTITSYFWMSYCEASLSDTVFAFDFTKGDTYNNIYQYDGGNVTGYITGAQKEAAVYTVKNTTYNEVLKAVKLSFAYESDVSYKIEIYRGLVNDRPDSGTLVATQTGTTRYAGEYTIDLAEPITLSPGEKYSVVVTHSGNYYDVEVSTDLGAYQSVASASGKTYVFGNNTWFVPSSIDPSCGDMCVKALTCNSQEAPVTPPANDNPAPVTPPANDNPAPVTPPANDNPAPDTPPANDNPAPEEQPEEEPEIEKIENTITASDIFRTVSTKTQSFKINAKANGGAALSYMSNNKNVTVNSEGKVSIKKNYVGTAVITIMSAETDEYMAATKDITITVVPKGTKISSISNSSKGKIKLKWAKSNAAGGYEILYATNKQFKGAKKTSINKGSTVKKTISGLKKGTTYYVKIRAFKKVSGKKIYSSWSNAKSVKIKK